MTVNPSNELHALAALLADRAGRLEASADVLVTRAGAASWTGPAADRFRALMLVRRNELRVGAEALRDAARAVAAAGGAA